jgi:predicted RNA-binding protein with PUA-like domain
LAQFWLYKSEPFKWSWDDQVKAGEKGTHWNGVRNHLAKQNMMKMKLGDQGFFYHSNEGKEIVGIVEVCREFYPDDSDETGKFGMVDVRALRKLPRAISLAEVKATPALAKMALITSMRLSVQPILASEWDFILTLSKT